MGELFLLHPVLQKSLPTAPYSKEVVIRDFCSEGDDKVIYWKKF
jgi:hypothetical protein